MTIVDRALSRWRDHRKIPPSAKRKIALALQGGGSFGAFTWGVLDRLLEEADLEFDAVSGASAGAVNAVLLAAGLMDGGRQEARTRLARFWKRMGKPGSPLRFSVAGKTAGLDFLTKVMSPYQFNPLDLNPLRAALLKEVDFTRLAAASPVALIIAATRVSDGKSRLFRNAELTVEAVLASACLPQYQQAVIIGGEAYWDGGYALNPPIVPLAHESDAPRILVVQLTPMRMDNLPRSPQDIEKRLDRIAFNATLNAQIEALRIGAEAGATQKLRALRIDTIAAEDSVSGLAARSAANTDWNFLEELRDGGRKAAGDWLEAKDDPEGASMEPAR